MKQKLTMVMAAIFSLLVFNTTAIARDSNEGHFIYYTDQGEGPALVLIHAFPTDQHLWDPQREELKRHFRLITLDLWGFGQSAKTDGQAVSMDEYADEAKQLLDKSGIKHAIIGGESMGGYVTLAFLENYPNMVDGLILSDAQAIADSPEAMQKREAAAIEVLQNGSKKLIDGFMPKALSSHASEKVKTQLRKIAENQSATGIASALRGMALRHDTSRVLKNSSLPVLIITGENDVLISPEQSRKMHKLAKNSQLVVIKDAGHLSSLEKPNDWNQAVIKVFSK